MANEVQRAIAAQKKLAKKTTKGVGLKRYQGVRVNGKRITNYGQIKSKPAGRKTTKDRISGGVKLAIL